MFRIIIIEKKTMASAMMKYLTEFLGTMAFLFVILKFPNAFAIGAALCAVILVGGKVSGGHFNPAVSVMKFVDGAISQKDAFAYIVAQVLGGLAALQVHGML